MNLEISEEKLASLVENEVRKHVANKVESIMNNGKAYWFTQQNIEHITRACIMDKISSEIVNGVVKSLDKKAISEALTKGLVSEIGTNLFG